MNLVVLIALAFAIIFNLLAMIWFYPFHFYKEQIKKTKKDVGDIKISFSYRALQEYLFDSSVNDLVQFLYKEEVNQKSKVELFIRHYESIKKVKLDYNFPFLVLLSLVLTIVVSLYALPVEQYTKALNVIISIIILMITASVSLKTMQFLEKLVFNTNDKYNYLLNLLTEIYLTRYSGSYLLKEYSPKN